MGHLTKGILVPGVNEAFDLIGAARGIRTPDPIITNDVLYQLSYCGMREEAGLRQDGCAPRA
jgi:hypothetical protein